ncbi:MAG: hypothetical protein ACF8OB_05700 [Phycisphaeraceae bacterium JB051]
MTSAINNKRKTLRQAFRQKQMIQFSNPYEDGTIIGYPVSLSDTWLLLANIDDSVRYNGFHCIRIADIRSLKYPFAQAQFFIDALQIRQLSCPSKPDIKLSSIQLLLKSAARLFPVTTIHRQRIDPDICHIGQVVNVPQGQLSLLEIGPDAEWDKTPTTYNLREITRVDFGGDYEEALHLVSQSRAK